jgi:hypothetical protein
LRPRIENIADEATIREVDRAYRAKSSWQGRALRQVVSAEVRRFTMRLVPV